MRADSGGEELIDVLEDLGGGTGGAPGGFGRGGAAEAALVEGGEDDAFGGEDGWEGVVGVCVVGEAVEEDDVGDGGNGVRGLEMGKQDVNDGTGCWRRNCLHGRFLCRL